MTSISSLVQYVQEAFGDPELPTDGPGLQTIPLRKDRPVDVMSTYRDYRISGGEPIPVWETRLPRLDESVRGNQ
jgi:hypothetical protein